MHLFSSTKFTPLIGIVSPNLTLSDKKKLLNHIIRMTPVTPAPFKPIIVKTPELLK